MCGKINVPDLAYGVAVPSAIAKGRIEGVDRSTALAVPGVIEVLAHDNRPSVASSHKTWASWRSCVAAFGGRWCPGSRSFLGGRRGIRDRPVCGDASRRDEEEKAVTDLDTQIDQASGRREQTDGILPMAAGASRGDADKALSQSRDPQKLESRHQAP